MRWCNLPATLCGLPRTSVFYRQHAIRIEKLAWMIA